MGAQLRELYRYNDGGKNQECLKQPARDHAAIRKQPIRSFAGKTGFRTRQSRADGRDKFPPRRGPLDEQLGRVVKFDGRFELEYFGQTGWLQPPTAKYF